MLPSHSPFKQHQSNDVLKAYSRFRLQDIFIIIFAFEISSSHSFFTSFFLKGDCFLPAFHLWDSSQKCVYERPRKKEEVMVTSQEMKCLLLHLLLLLWMLYSFCDSLRFILSKSASRRPSKRDESGKRKQQVKREDSSRRRQRRRQMSTWRKFLSLLVFDLTDWSRMNQEAKFMLPFVEKKRITRNVKGFTNEEN